MSIKILSNRENTISIFYCSTTEFAFGPIVRDSKYDESARLANKFLEWLGEDPRQLKDYDLMSRYAGFLALEWEECRDCFDSLVMKEKGDICQKCLGSCYKCGEEERETITLWTVEKRPGMEIKRERRVCASCQPK